MNCPKRYLQPHQIRTFSAQKPYSRAELFEAAMPESDALERAIDRHLKNIRAKLAEGGAAELLETVRGVGYRLADR